ncbi:MAG: hypothetical protein RL094_640 [Candidatus Parcubacteria bacterium]|jgi:RND family efflux transporter MFP subunit
MKKHIHTLGSYLKRPLISIPLAIVLLAGSAFAFSSGSSSSATNIVTVTPKEFVQEVAVTGKVVSAQDVSLGFETSGRIAQVKVKVGEKVASGQVLAYVANGDYAAAVSQRQAIVDSEQARLDELERGSRPEDLTLAQSDVDSATISLEQSKRTIVDEIKDAYVKADDAVRNKIDQLYSNPRSATPEILPFNSNNTSANFRTSLNDQRLRAGEMLTKWGNSLSTLTSDSYTSAYLTDARTNVAQMRNFLNDLSLVVSSVETNPSLSQTTIDKYKSDISLARTNISSAVSGLTTAEQSYSTYTAQLKKAQEQLALKRAGSTREQIDAQAAQVKSAYAQLQSARASYAKTVITSPIEGIVTKVDGKAGEIVSPNSPVISLISAANYEIESYISETDIAKIKLGQQASVTLDAYGKNAPFNASVTLLDPAETVLDGVSTYKATFQFSQNDERIKSGMTANIVIQTDKRQDVIIIPQQAIFLKNGQKMVTVKSASGSQDRVVQTGSINNNGEIEIVSGLAAGDQVLVSTK